MHCWTSCNANVCRANIEKSGAVEDLTFGGSDEEKKPAKTSVFAGLEDYGIDVEKEGLDEDEGFGGLMVSSGTRSVNGIVLNSTPIVSNKQI